MPDSRKGYVAIVDYGMGNLFSVRQACEQVGIRTILASTAHEIESADGVILPGVGSFGDAMKTLIQLDLVSCLKDVAVSQKPLMGICLGMQLLMTEGHEFGTHKGLGIIEGEVLALKSAVDSYDHESKAIKVPQVGWNQIFANKSGLDGKYTGEDAHVWKSPMLHGLHNGEYMYFVHSFYPDPENADLVASYTRYGNFEFCSSIRIGNIFACQFHPERSSWAGINIYRNLAELLKTRRSN